MLIAKKEENYIMFGRGVKGEDFLEGLKQDVKEAKEGITKTIVYPRGTKNSEIEQKFLLKKEMVEEGIKCEYHIPPAKTQLEFLRRMNDNYRITDEEVFLKTYYF